MKNSFLRIICFLLVAIFSAACIQERAVPQDGTSSELAFSVDVDSPYFIYNEPVKSELVSEDGTVIIPLSCKVTEGMPSDFSGQTKGATFEYANLCSLGTFQVTAYDSGSKLIDNKSVKYYSDKTEWLLQDNPKMWLNGHTMTFFANTNLPTGSSISNITSSSQTFTCNIQSTAANQKDALLGYYSGNGGGNGQATIKFNHPLTAVIFKIGGIVSGDRTHTVTGIQSVTLKGVYSSGTATATGSGDVLAYNWGSTRSATTNVSEPLTGPVGTVGEPFLLIPQNLASANVTLEAVLTTAGGTKKSTATLNTGEWQAGKTNTYVLGYTDYIAVESISINKSTTTIKKTDSETLVATVLPADADNKTVTWTTSDASVATVNAAGQVTAVGVGTCQITATPADGVSPVNCIVTVINPVVNITLDNADLVLAQTGEKNNKTLVATVTYYDGTVKYSNNETCVTWSSSNENVASVTPDGGLVLANVDKGTSYSTIRATTIDMNEQGNPMTAECSLNVPYFSITPTCYVTNGTSSTMYRQAVAHSNTGMTPVSLTYYVDNTYNGGTLEYVVLDDAATGQIHGHYVGTARVYAIADYGNGILNTSNDCIVTVGPAEFETETIIDLSPSEMRLSPQEEGQATVNMRYHLGQSWQYDQNVNWTTSNSGVAVVNALGIVTGIAAGTCTITATSQYESTISGHVSQSMTVIVNNDAHITLNRTSLGMLIGDEFDLTARVTHTDGSRDNNVSWATSNASVATVTNGGHVVAIGVGSCTLTATSNINPAITQTCAVSVTNSAVSVTGVTLNKNVIVIAPSATGELAATIAPSGATNMDVTWTSSNTNVVTVAADGLSCVITAVGIGKATVTVTTDDGGYTATCTVLVPGLVIPGNSNAATSGNYMSGTYLIGSAGSTIPLYYSLFPAEIYDYVSAVAWTPSDAGKFTVSWDGASTHRSTASIVSSYSFTNYTASVQVTLSTGQMLTSNTLTVSKQTGTHGSVTGITVSPSTISTSAGTLTAVSTAVSEKMTGGTTYKDTNVKWSSSDDEIAVVVNDGGVLKVRALKRGSCTITAAAAWDLSKTASISVTVN